MQRLSRRRRAVEEILLDPREGLGPRCPHGDRHDRLWEAHALKAMPRHREQHRRALQRTAQMKALLVRIPDVHVQRKRPVHHRDSAPQHASLETQEERLKREYKSIESLTGIG